jgi:hypothetical protein
MMQMQVMPGMTDFIKQDRQRNSWLHIMGRLRPASAKCRLLRACNLRMSISSLTRQRGTQQSSGP